jgi:DNA-binding MarR family transcriptional regulator
MDERPNAARIALEDLVGTPARARRLYKRSRALGRPDRDLQVLAAIALLGVSAVAETLELDGDNTSRICRGLEKLGLLHRATDKWDRRAVRLSLTPHGQHLVRRLIDTAYKTPE